MWIWRQPGRRMSKVSNAAGYSNEAVAELVICMALSLLRNVPQVEARCRAGQTKDGLVGSELKGKTVGIIGVGAHWNPGLPNCSMPLAVRCWAISAM